VISVSPAGIQNARDRSAHQKMLARLDEKIAMITGASRGIGRPVALAFAAEGADIAIVGMTDEVALAGVEKEIAALGRR